VSALKQLMIMCSADISETVRDALVASEIEGFLKIPHAVGSKPGATWSHGRYPLWEAEVYLAAIEDAAVQPIVDRLKDYAGHCDVEPCLRILVSSLDAVY
jgi:hypothetical protein